MITGAGTHGDHEANDNVLKTALEMWPWIWRPIPGTERAWEMVQVPPDEAPPGTY